MTTYRAELPELCRWAYMWVNPDEQECMLARHLERHVRERERLLRAMERGGPEEQAWAALARVWIAQGGEWPA